MLRIKRLFFFILALTLTILSLNAQTQQGYVKTKGRLGNNGVVVAGTRLPGATITVKGSNAVVSGNKGTFTLAIPNNNYYLQNVQKQGYVLTDPDVLSKQYAYSKNPLVLVLETPEQQADDKLATEKKIRRTLQRQLQEKEDEIESLKEQKKLNDEEYRKQLQEIYAQQESNEKLINEMAERYSKIDYDQLDEFNARISQLILDGKLTEADSLLNTKGDINSRIGILHQHQEANTQAEQEIQKKLKKLEKSKELTQKELEDLAQDCYSKFEIFKMQHLNDSAAYYIELRATLDTTNVEWLIETGDFQKNYFSNFDKAMQLYKKANRNAIAKYGTIDKQVATTENCIGADYAEMGKYEDALKHHMHALEIQQNCLGISTVEISKTYCEIGTVYFYLNQIKQAIDYYIKDEQIVLNECGEDNEDLIATYTNLSQAYYSLDNYEKAFEYGEKSLNLCLKIHGDNNLTTATIYNNMGVVYKNKGDEIRDTTCYVQALNLYKKALSIRLEWLGENHPLVASVYNNMSGVYDETGDYQKSLEYGLKDLTISLKILGPDHPDVATSYNNVALTHKRLKNYEEALTYYKIALEIRKKVFGEESIDVAVTYNNLGSLYYGWDKLNISKDYFEKALRIFKANLGDDHKYIKVTTRHLEQVLQEMQQKMDN